MGEVSAYKMAADMPTDSRWRVAADPLNSRVDFQMPASIFEANAGNLNLTNEEQIKMLKSIEDVFEPGEDAPNDDVDIGDDDEEDSAESAVDLEDQNRRTERLKGILSTLAQLWWVGSEQMDLVAEKLADGSRDRKSFTCKISSMLGSVLVSLFPF